MLLFLDPPAFTSSHPSPFFTISYFVAHNQICYVLLFFLQIQPDPVPSQILHGKVIFLRAKGTPLGGLEGRVCLWPRSHVPVLAVGIEVFGGGATGN